MHLAGAQHVSFATALKRAGYQGLISCGAGCGAGTLKPMGKAADGILFPTDFSYDTPTPAGQKFVEAFKADNNGDEPSAFAAAAYDAMQLIIQSIKNAPDTSGEAVKDSMTDITTQGMDGTTGKITFEDRDARVPGLLVEWRDGAEHVIQP
jgi:branched-chain amino acid transport system substrate-binding protein